MRGVKYQKLRLLKDSTLGSGKERQVTKSALIMVGSYVVIYTPGFLNYLFNNLSGDNGIPRLALVSFNIGWSHAFINPLMSLFFNPIYRNECLKVLKIKKEEPKRKSLWISRNSVRTSKISSSPKNNKVEWVWKVEKIFMNLDFWEIPNMSLFE